VASPAPPREEPALAEPTERDRRREAELAELDARLVASLKKGVDALLDKKADKVVVLNLQGLTSMSDYFVLATATSGRQAQALADAVEEAMKTGGRRPMSVEGYRSAAWILLDYGDVVFHVFHDEARRFYGLERLWGDAPDATSAFVAAGPPPRR
jgi:ribosome-associated protein